MPQRGSSCGLGTAIAGAPASGCGGGDDFDALRFLAAEQGDELEEVARRVAGLSLGRVEVLSRQLEEARLQVRCYWTSGTSLPGNNGSSFGSNNK